ncbi:PilT/PilU family type 4a pilus ATPase [Cardiobacterium hominis]|uniref:PilT/PilU family type 4a pilus ATPase n=1 Tax=Cardiobacterium hominis TaxID=2718 RepID=UPI0028D3AB3B|nr:PilT/PilU family type 4a pilus ATPase [Cardiobacterium hominis]
MAGFCSQAESRRDDRDGDIKRLNLPPLDRQQLRDMIYSIMTDSQVKNFEEHWEADFSTEVKGISRFRVNVFNQNRGLAVVFRTIPSRVLSLEDLKAPEKFVDIIDVPRGLVLVTGPTGSGKSTTLASMIDHRNENSSNHIITVEDPIEFVHKPKKSVVIQREVGIDTASYGTALKNSLRQAPDVILIGEIRDVDTMQYAMHFAETGHLCLATLHATNSVQALERIYNFFPREQRHQIQPELAENLHCLITQRLLPRSDRPGRIVAMEMMMNTPYISHLISEGDLGSIPEAMERGNPAEGVFTFDHSIFELYESGVISFQDAINYVESENNFRIRIRAQSNRRLPPEMQSRGEIFSVKSDDALSRELMRKDREERERLRKEGKL